MSTPRPERRPPKKVKGQATGLRRFDGALWDVATAAQQLGETEKQTRSQIARGLLPHRRLGGRVVLIADEVREYLRQLPGVTAADALANVAARRDAPEAAR
jgi:hypothetical protein